MTLSFRIIEKDGEIRLDRIMIYAYLTSLGILGLWWVLK